MNKAQFAKIEAESVRAVSGNATATALARAFAPLSKLSPEEKISAVLHFVDRDARVRKKNGSGDWLAWYFVHGAIRGAQVLPWTRKSLEHVLEAIGDECMALPPEFVARAVGQFVKAHGPLDVPLRALVLRAAKSMWPPGATEGANFKKAAAALKELTAMRG